MAGACSGAGTPANVSAVKWGGSGGTDLTQRGSTLNIGLFGKASQWSLVAPTAASQTLYASWPSNQDETGLGGVSYTGVDQTTPHGTQATATNELAPTVNVTSAAGELVSDVVWHVNPVADTTTITAGASQTARVNIGSIGGAGFESLGMSEEAGSATVTMSWTIDGTTTDSGIIGIPIKPAAAGGSSIVPIVDKHYRHRRA